MANLENGFNYKIEDRNKTVLCYWRMFSILCSILESNAISTCLLGWIDGFYVAPTRTRDATLTLRHANFKK